MTSQDAYIQLFNLSTDYRTQKIKKDQVKANLKQDAHSHFYPLQ